jgi:hypothetical protein
MKIKDQVRHIMENSPSSRESKNIVIGIIWKRECEAQGIENIDDVLDALAQKRLTNPETIRRSICKVWEEHPELKPSLEVRLKNEELRNRLHAGRGELDVE